MDGSGPGRDWFDNATTTTAQVEDAGRQGDVVAKSSARSIWQMADVVDRRR